MGVPRIRYNGKSILFTNPDDATAGVGPVRRNVNPIKEGTVTTTLTGVAETITPPRRDIHVVCDFQLYHQETLRYQLENWWQWAQLGNPWTFSMDSDDEIFTTLTVATTVGANSVQVADATGITAGSYYCLKGGPYYQTLKVATSGVSGTTITFDTTLDYVFEIGATFRSRYYWPAIIRDPNAPVPFSNEDAKEIGDLLLDACFYLKLDFFEDVIVPPAPIVVIQLRNPEISIIGLPTHMDMVTNS